MARIYLTNRDKKAPKGEWELILGKARVQLTDPQGIIAADFGMEEADKRFQFPSFWMSVKDLGINIEAKKVIWFKPDKQAIAEIQRYLAYGLAAQGEGAISSARWKGWSLLIVGLLILIGGAAFLGIAIATLQGGQLSRGQVAIPVALMVGGGVMMGTGVTLLARARRAVDEWGEAEEEEDPV